MARTIINTSGTSVLDNLTRSGKTDWLHMRSNFEGKLPAQVETLYGQPEGEWTGSPKANGNVFGAWWLIDHYGRLPPQSDAASPVRQSAELTSLSLLDPDVDDEIVFLSSDTPNGMFCALVVAHLMKEQNDSVRVRKYEDNAGKEELVNWGWLIKDPNVPHFEIPRAGLGKIALYPIKGLSPNNRQSFERQGAGNLVRTMVRLVRDAKVQGRIPVLNFTGGYKATIPLLTQVASWMGDSGISMVALYQDSEDLVRIPVTDSRPDPSLWEQLNKYLAEPNRTVASLPTGSRRFFEDTAGPAGAGLKWSLLGEALSIVMSEAAGQ